MKRIEYRDAGENLKTQEKRPLSGYAFDMWEDDERHASLIARPKTSLTQPWPPNPKPRPAASAPKGCLNPRTWRATAITELEANVDDIKEAIALLEQEEGLEV